MRTFRCRSLTIGYEIPIAIHCSTARNDTTCSTSTIRFVGQPHGVCLFNFMVGS